ncbi:unnamed protein product [Camellia sinensis]
MTGTEFFELDVESGIDSFSRASNAESVREDEDELLWAALSRFPSQKQTNFTLLRLTMSKFDSGKERSEAIDVRKLDCFNRELVVKRALATTEQDNYKLLSAIKECLNRVIKNGTIVKLIMANKKIDFFFKKRGSENIVQSSTNNVETSTPLEQRPSKLPRVEFKDVDTSSLVRDPGLRQQIWDYSVSERDEIRRVYIKSEPYQPKAPNNQPFETDKNGRRFLDSWYKLFPDWLEYSPTKNRAFCLPCFLFTKPTRRPRSSAFTVEGFSSWKKVNKGKNCPLLSHMGKDPNSSHRVAIKCCCDLTNQAQHIEAIIEKQTSIQIARNRLRLKTSIDVIKWLTFQACAFRGRDERHESNNRGNVIELIKLLASYNEDVAAVVLENAPQNASYHSHGIQKQILSIFSNKIQRFIREEINDGKFCILVDESEDESKREQMAIVLRFVDKYGFIKERFFDIVHVLDTTSATLKEEICIVLSRHNLSVQNIRGQGYDGASNMSGEWTRLHALFCAECPFAYYVHCFAHRLQLALVGASKQK